MEGREKFEAGLRGDRDDQALPGRGEPSRVQPAEGRTNEHHDARKMGEEVVGRIVDRRLEAGIVVARDRTGVDHDAPARCVGAALGERVVGGSDLLRGHGSAESPLRQQHAAFHILEHSHVVCLLEEMEPVESRMGFGHGPIMQMGLGHEQGLLVFRSSFDAS